jgi:hypothetical protein
MPLLTRIADAFSRWLLDPVPAQSMVLLRIGLGATLFLAYLSRWPLVDVLFGPDGFAGFAYYERFPESGPVNWEFMQAFDQLQHASSGALVWTLYGALLASSACFALGIRSRWTGLLALVLHTLFVGRNPASFWGWSTMIKPFLIYAILAARPGHLGVEQWWRRRRGGITAPRDETCSAWPLRLVQFHVACAFFVLWQRVDKESWLSGQMLFAALQCRDWGRIDFDWHPYLGVLEVAGVAALVLELSAAFLLWVPVVRRYCALALIGMFATLVLTTSVGWWDFMMLFALATFLPDTWLRWVRASPARGSSPPRARGRPRER